jgi:DNA/RNA-binding domain of Phe-tRNA-synthetase-like protein
VGSYDVDRIDSNVSFRLGVGSEAFKGIGKETINTESLPLFADSLGPFGSPTSDSERTMIRTETKRVLTAIIVFDDAEGLPLLLQKSQDWLKQYASAAIQETRIV